jgi:hypothetical protein
MAIADVRTQPVGSRVVVEGVTTVAPGMLDEGFAVQDRSGGIYVARPAGATLSLGTTARVEGMVSAPDDRVTIEPVFVAVTGRAAVPAPLAVRTGAVGAETEGRLIAVRGRVVDVADDGPWGVKIYVDDGSGRLLVFVTAATGIDTSRYRPGHDLRVTGFSGRYATHTELLPRAPSDLVEPD